MRLIDAERLKAELRKSAEYHENRRLGYFSAITHIDEQPTVEAVEVVRCIDCKHFHTETVEEQTPYGFTNDIKVCGCMLRGEWVDVFIDDFCSYGERKEK